MQYNRGPLHVFTHDFCLCVAITMCHFQINLGWVCIAVHWKEDV